MAHSSLLCSSAAGRKAGGPASAVWHGCGQPDEATTANRQRDCRPPARWRGGLTSLLAHLLEADDAVFICGVSYCHFMRCATANFVWIHSRQICHQDLKLENTPLDGSPAPRLKICDFGYH